MPNKITYTIKTADGKEHQVSKENIDKHGIQSYADAYEGATIRMRDSKKGDYDIPLSNYNDAKAQGLHAFSWEHKPVVAQNNPQATQKQPAPKVNTTPGTPMTAAQKAQVLNNTSGIVDQSQSDLSRTMRKIDYAKQNTGLDVKPIKLGENRNVATKKNKNGQTTYLDAEGNRFDDHAQANFSQTQIEEDEAKRKDLLGYIDKKAMSSVNSAYDKQYSELEDFKKKHPYLSAFSRALSAFSGRMSGGGTANINQYRPEEARTGLAALAFNQKTRQAIDEGKRYEQGDTGFRGRSTRGLKKGLTSASTYDFGISDTDIAGSLKEAADRYAKGQATQMDELLLDAAALNSETEAKYADALGGWFGAGEAIPGVASFMMQIGSNPMSGFGKATAQSVAKTVIKRAVQKFGTGLAAKAAITLAKGATRVAADAVEAGVVTAMYSPTKIVGDYLNRKTGTVVHDGNGGYTFEGKEYSNIKAVAKAINDQNAENLSEMWGDYLPGIGKVGKLIGKGARKIGLGKVVNAFEQMSSSQWMKTWNEFMDRTKWNGLSGEYMEEAEKNLYNALTNGDMTLDTNPNTGVFSRKINEDTFKSVALMSGIMSGISTVGYTRFKYKASRGQKKADNNAKAVLGAEKWSEIKKLIDNADDKSIGGIIEQIGNDNSLNTKQKMAILDYQYKSAVAHGANIQDLKNKLEGNYDEKANRYDAGYNATENKLANIKNELELRHRQLAETFKDDPSALQKIEEDPKAFLQGLKESEVGGKKAKVINAYEETRAAYDGMIQRVKDNIDDAITENNTVIEQRTHQDGNIYSATMKLDDRKVYVVGGNVQMNEDGKGIDHEKSSSSVMIRDAETGKIEMVDPFAILSVDTPVNAEEEKATSSEQIKQTYAQEQANKIDGVLEFKAGDTYSILDEDQNQHTIQIIGEVIDEKTKQPNPDMVMASIDGLEPTMLPKKQIQAMNDEENLWRLEQSLKQGEEVENTTPHSAQSYNLNDEITLINEDGKPVRGSITTDQNEDGKFEVYTEEPINGKRVNLLTAEELDAMHAQIQGEQMESPALVAENATTQKENVAGLNDGTIAENTTVQKEAEIPHHQPTALERIPTNEQGEPIYEQVDPETAWDAIVEQTEGDESIAQSVADGMVADMEAAVKRAEKAKVKGGTTIAEKIAAEKERVANIEQAKATLEHWKKIASTNSRRQEAIQAEERRKSKEAALQEQEEKERAMREEEERVKRDLAQPQALDYKLSDEVDENGYPFVLTSAGEVAFGKIGKETGLTPAPILLSEGVITNSKTNAGYGLVHIEARHGEQIRNAGYPSVVAFVEEVAKHYDVIREGINRSGEQTYMLQLTDRHNNTLMVELSGDGTYYNINTAGIFKTSYGKNRREVYNRHATDNQSTESGEESQGEAQSGTTSPSRMKSSTRSSAGKVSETSNAVQGNAEKSSENEESIENQENKSEEEIVIKEKIRKAINAYEEAQEKFDNLFSLLVKEKESDPFDNREWREVNRTKEELKDVLLQLNIKELSELLKQVSGENTEYVIKNVLDILNREEHRLIAFNAILDKQSNITPEYKEEEKAIPVSEFVETDKERSEIYTMLTGVFHDKGYVVGTDAHLLLARKEDYDKSLEGKVTNKKGEVINGKYPNWRAVVNSRKQGKSWGVNLEELHAFTRGVLTKLKTEKVNPSTKKDAKIAFKTADGKIVLCYANALDKVLQGAKSIGAKSFFSNDDVFAITQTPKGYVICPMLNQEQNIDDNTFAYVPRVSELQHSTETTHSSNVVHSFGNSASQNNASIKLSDTSFASEEEASIFITQMELDADIAQEIPLTIENWDKEFGEDGIVSTPIGDVKMGENQFAKLMRAGRNGKLGMLKPTLEYPDAIVEENSKAKEGTNTERPSSFIFIKSFRKPDGTRYYYFTSITVSVEGKEVVVSNQEKSRNRILRLLMGNSVIWRTPKDATTSSAEKQGLDYVHPDKAEGETKGSVITPQNTSSAGKVSESSNVVQENTEKTSENEDLFAKAERIASQEQGKRTRKNKATRVETNPTEAQKEAGNYKKGHIKVDGMNITIEQPKGSIRRGKDASGKEWESEMHNTYGYIRGTEGVDGDHIDIFLSDNPNEGNVFVVDQVNKDGSFDEHKVMYGFADKESARQAYLSNYEDGWQGLGNITEVSKEEFKKWIDSSKRKTKPFAEYKGIIKSNKGVSSAVAMSEDEYLASKGLNGNMTDYMLDKLRIPHSETARQQKLREKEAARVRADFDNQKEEARKEYRQKIAKGELRQPTKQEAKEREIAKLIKTANGHEDNPSVQAARRSLAKRGVDWRTDKGDTSDNDLADKKELEDFERVEKKIMPGLNNDLTRLRLRALKEGELSHVERRYIENKGFSFVGNERIESIEDVAYIFKQLETSSVENSFIALIKDGKPTILHLSIGGYTMTAAPIEQAIVAVEAIKPDKVVFIHNHPSGNIKASKADLEVQRKMKATFGDKAMPAIIINTTSGKFGTFSENGNLEDGKMPQSKEQGNIPVKVYNFSQQVFAKDWNPDTAFKVFSSESIAAYVSSHRLGEHKKMSLLILNHAGHVTGNVFLPWTTLKDAEKHENVLQIASYVNQMGGTAAVIYGNYKIGKDIIDTNESIRSINKQLSDSGLYLMDVINITDSAHDRGVMEEKISYGSSKVSQESNIQNTTRDAEYIKAVENNDTETIQRLLSEEAERKGYSNDSSYQGSLAFNGAAPSQNAYFETKEERKEAWENDEYEDTMSLGDYVDSGIDTNNLEWNLTDPMALRQADPERREAIENLRQTVRSNSKTITIYRAVDANIKENEIRNGDWVTPSRSYAEYHIGLQDWENGRVIEQEVSIDDLWWDGNDIAEWGYDNGKDYAYKNTENSRKLNDLITRDDQGNVILPSQRFNDQVEDERFRNDEELEKVNQRFNEELENLTEENADKITLWLGNPSDVLLSSGIENKPLKLYGNKVIKKMKKHGFALDELRDLPKAVADPIAVFDNLGRLGNRSILTELTTEQGNFLVTIDMGKGEKDVDFNIVSSVFGKGESKIVSWIERGLTAYINKKKALNYLHHSAPIAEALSNSRLSSVANIVKSFENPTNSSEKVLDRKTTQAKEVTEKEHQQMAERANELAKTLHLDNVEIVTNVSTLEGKKAKAKGFYSTSTGKITIVIPNHSNIADVEKTLLHEAVAHHGLRKLFGEHFDNFLDNVFKNASEDVRREIVKLAAKNKWDFRIATEEYLASLAEDTNFEKMPNGLWDKVKRLFSDMLRSIGLLKQKDGELNDNELRYILWRSYKNLKEKGQSNSILNKAEDIAMQHRLKVGNYAPQEEGKAKVSEKPHKTEKVDNNTIFYRKDEPEVTARTIYEDAVKDTGKMSMLSALAHTYSKEGRERFKHKFSESYFDYSRSIKQLQDAISKASGRKLEEFEEVWKSLNAKSSIDSEEINLAMLRYISPLSIHIAEMIRGVKMDGQQLTLDDVEVYMNALHGIERNAYMANSELKSLVNKNLEKWKEHRLKKLRNSGISKEEALSVIATEEADKRDEITQLNMGKTRKDYSGLTALFSDENTNNIDVAILEERAQKYVDAFEEAVGKDKVDEMWKKVKNLNDFSIRKAYLSGLINKKHYDEIKNMYEHYVPLRGWHDDYAGDIFEYVNAGQSMDTLQGVVKKAYGRTTRAGNILGTMASMANTAIVQGNKNLVAQKFLNLALNYGNKSGLLMVSKQWYEETASGELVPLYPSLKEGMSATEMQQRIEEFEAEMEEAKKSGTKKIYTRSFGDNMPQNFQKWQEKQHSIRALRNGVEHTIYVLGNPKAAQAFNGLLTPESQVNAVQDIIMKVMRFQAMMQTSLSPEFVISNFQRDVLTAATGTYIKYGWGAGKDFASNLTKVMPVSGLQEGNPFGIYNLIHKYNKGTLDKTNDIERMFDEFVRKGGMTGISSITRAEEFEKQMEKSVKRIKRGKLNVPQQLWEDLADGIEFMNKGIENATRFAAYMTSRKMGKNVTDSIFDAKECSVNFNMKGSGAWGNLWMRRYILYANPALQSLRMLGTWYEASPKRFMGVFSTVLTASILTAMLGYACGGDDGDDNDWYKLNEFNRYNYISVKAGNGFVHWSLSQEIRPVWALGQIIFDWSNSRVSAPIAINSMATQLNNLSPMAFFSGGSDNDDSFWKTAVKAWTPTVVADFMDAYAWNENFLGKNITYRNDWNKEAPEWRKAGKDTPKWAVNLSRAWNKATGGADNRKSWWDSPALNPSAVYYIMSSQFGGMGTLATKLSRAFEQWQDPEQEVEARNIPFVSKFWVTVGDDYSKNRVLNEEFKSIWNEWKLTDYEIKHNKSDLEKGLITDEEYANLEADKKYLANKIRYEALEDLMKDYNTLMRKRNDENDNPLLDEEILELKKKVVERAKMLDK